MPLYGLYKPEKEFIASASPALLPMAFTPGFDDVNGKMCVRHVNAYCITLRASVFPAQVVDDWIIFHLALIRWLRQANKFCT